jgi:ABC-type transport system involved in Fe-S cluster assembly fused permease/ATPase subunit
MAIRNYDCISLHIRAEVDEIVVLCPGRMLERGTQTRLLAAGGY